MITPNSPTVEKFRDFLHRTNQTKNLEYFAKILTDDEREAMATSYFSNCELDWHQLTEIVENVLLSRKMTHTNPRGQYIFSNEIFSNRTSNIFRADAPAASKWTECGLKSLADGECAVCILAGGQATRLNQGKSTPKGCFVIPHAPSGKSLFQLLVEKVHRAEAVAFQYCTQSRGTAIRYPRIPVLIFTSTENNAEITSFFRKNDFFGLHESQVFFLAQRMLPVLRYENPEDSQSLGVIFKSATKVAFAPSGNGALYRTLAESGLSAHLRKIGVRFVQVCPVDNPLVDAADAALLGLCKDQGIDVGCKGFAVPIGDFDKSAGVFCGEFTSEKANWPILEYSELDENFLAQPGKRGRNEAFVIANMAVHCLSLDFCDRVWASHSQPLSSPEYHIAEKRIPTCQCSEGAVDGMKLESFIFDAFHHAEKIGICIVDKAAEFSPIKRPDPPLSDMQDLGNVPEGTPLAARLALLRNDLRQFPFGSWRDLHSLSTDVDAFSFEIDPMLPVVLPAEMIRLGITEHGIEAEGKALPGEEILPEMSDF